MKLWICLIVLVGTMATARAGLTIALLENTTTGVITVTGSGSINLTGLTLQGPGPASGNYIYKSSIWVGIEGSTPANDRYVSTTGNTQTGTLSDFVITPSLTLINGSWSSNGGNVNVAAGYVSGNSIAFADSFSNTFANMGITAGDFRRITWTATGGGDFIEITTATTSIPEPSMGVMAMIGAIGFLVWRRKSKE